MGALDLLEEQMGVARRMVDLHVLLCNSRRRALRAPVRDRLLDVYNISNRHYADAAQSDQLRILILRGPIKVDRHTFSAGSLAFLLRQALVVGVSALEAFFQEEYRENCYSVYDSVRSRILKLEDNIKRRRQPGRVPRWERELEALHQARILKEVISLGDHTRVAHYKGDRSGWELRRALVAQRSRQSLQSPSDIAELFKCLDLTRFWDRVAQKARMDRREITGRLERINERRNQIIHNADRPFRRGSTRLAKYRAPIAVKEVEEDLAFLESVCKAAHLVIRDHVSRGHRSALQALNG